MSTILLYDCPLCHDPEGRVVDGRTECMCRGAGTPSDGYRVVGGVARVSFVVHGRPLSVNRAYAPRKRNRKTERGMMLTEAGIAYKAHVATCARIAMNGADPLQGPVRIRGVFYFDRKIAGTEPPLALPDCDGPIKPTKDALQGIVYPEDKWVASQSWSKEYDPGMPRVEVSVEGMPR